MGAGPLGRVQQVSPLRAVPEVVAAAVVGAAVAWPVAIVATVVLAATWGRYVAPRSGSRLDDPWRLALEVALFGLLGVALALVGHPLAGAVLALSSVVVAGLLRLVDPQH